MRIVKSKAKEAGQAIKETATVIKGVAEAMNSVLKVIEALGKMGK